MNGDHFVISGDALRGLDAYVNAEMAASAGVGTGADQIHVAWRVDGAATDCKFVGPSSKCFCGHRMRDHHKSVGASSISCPCTYQGCKCKQFAYIPNHGTWTLKCNCKHDPEEHSFAGSRKCLHPGCRCGGFTSTFTCECGQPWANHRTVFEMAGPGSHATFASLAAGTSEYPRTIEGPSAPAMLTDGSARIPPATSTASRPPPSGRGHILRPGSRAPPPVVGPPAAPEEASAGILTTTPYDLLMQPHTLGGAEVHASSAPRAQWARRAPSPSTPAPAGEESAPPVDASAPASRPRGGAVGVGPSRTAAQDYAQRRREQLQHAKEIREARERENYQKQLAQDLGGRR
ncbi:hypothetical protein PAPYR_3856 [Paratrimastix pyriformis]|uniref:Protein FAM221A n=1 Tax=Paratrimastix pyriformis TaxID=342808 RepID=A0ABQ8UTT3_9EUKA|nr:hypothetical protein PAPYR_3856 [Paratrimastix pyriformis]